MKLLASDYVVNLGITLTKNLTFYNGSIGCLLIVIVKYLLSNYFFFINENILLKLVSHICTVAYNIVQSFWYRIVILKLNGAFQHHILTLRWHNIILESLKDWRIRMDLTCYYKILNNLARLNQAYAFAPTIRRGHALSSVVPRTTTSRISFLSRRE